MTVLLSVFLFETMYYYYYMKNKVEEHQQLKPQMLFIPLIFQVGKVSLL